ncbi:MAG: lipopolysaccharide heptosyltransferase II [Candidatus Sumerlaeia bacterium]
MAIEKIYIKTVNWVGDAVLVTPTIRAIRQRYPDAEITLMARPWVAGVYDANPDIDRLWVAEENKSLRHYREIARRIRDEEFDLGISLPNSFGAALHMYLGKIKRRIGYKRDGRGILLTDPIPVTGQILKVHQVEYYLNLLQPLLDVEDQERKLVLPVADDARERLSERLETRGISLDDNERPLVGLCPGAAFGTAKRWYPDRFAAVADRLVEDWNARVVIVGSKSERPIGDEIQQLAKHEIDVLSGDMPLRELAALCEKLRLFVCNDSGAMHVAAACDAPVVAVFGSTDWITTAPYHPDAIIVRRDNPCPDAPCLRRDCPYDHHICMHVVTVEDVQEACEKQLEKSVGPNPAKSEASQ